MLRNPGGRKCVPWFCFLCSFWVDPASLKFHFPCLEISLFGFHFILSQHTLDQLFNGPLLLGSVCRTHLLLNYLCCHGISLKIQQMGYISRTSLPNILSHSCLTNSMRWWGHIKTFLTAFRPYICCPNFLWTKFFAGLSLSVRLASPATLQFDFCHHYRSYNFAILLSPLPFLQLMFSKSFWKI